MFTLILFSSLCLKALTPAVCAQPFKLDHNVNSKRSDVIDWPQLLGEDNRPKPEHVVEAYRAIVDMVGADIEAIRVDDYKWDDLLYGTSFWSTLLAITKLNPDGDWIKLIFDSVEPTGGTNELGSVSLGLYNASVEGAKPTPHGRSVDIASIPGTGEGGELDHPLWPLVIGQAVMDSGWDPEADDAGSIMEIITGYKSKTIENPSEDESWTELERGFYRPVIYRLTVEWWAGRPYPYKVVMQTRTNDDQRLIDLASVLGENQQPWQHTEMFPENPDVLRTVPGSITVIDDERFTHFMGAKPQ